MIVISNLSRHQQIDADLVEEISRSVLSRYGKLEAELSIAFVPREDIIELNRAWLDKDSDTDVISFNLGANPEGEEIGDIYICTDVAESNAQEHGCTLKQEIMRLVVHGVLHFVGFDDATDEQRAEMHDLENKFLEQYGL